MGRVAAAGIVLLALAGAGYVRGCAGPRPEVIATGLDATPAGRVPRATVRNGGGPGEVDVEFRLRERRTGRVLSAEGKAQLERGEQLEVRAPDALPPGDWEVAAEAEYPPP